MTTWPVSLPQYALNDSVNVQYQDITTRSQTAHGRERTRKMVSKAMRTISVGVAPLDATQKAALLTFFNTTTGGGASEFDWYDPEVPTSTVAMKFVGGSLSIKPFGKLTSLWRADFQVRILPT